MQPTTEFNGLTMPVFTAFGWAGEETALNFALSQLELFIRSLHATLPRDMQGIFPVYGLDRAGQSVYLATTQPPEEGLFVAFYARPMSLELSLGISNKSALAKAYKAIGTRPDIFIQQLSELGADWNLRLQQMEYDEESGQVTHYQDLYKDSASKLDEETGQPIIERAVFLNGEATWVVPIYISRRRDSEKVSAMGRTVLKIIREDIETLSPLIHLLTGHVRKTRAKPKPAAKPQPEVQLPEAAEETTIRRPADAADLDQFTYISELKPLHIRRGFVNLTRNHWPFFARNARSETRQVTVKYGERTDEKSSVWRLVPNDQARVVLSPSVQQWLEETFQPNDRIQVTAIRKGDDKIEVTLTPVQ